MKIQGSKIILKPLHPNDAPQLLELELRNREFFQAYMEKRNPTFYTLEAQVERIQKGNEKKKLDQYYLFGIFLPETNNLIGLIMLSGVQRGSLQHGYIGYFLDQAVNGKGYTSEAVRLLVNYAFKELKLHRIEAGVMPHNKGSIKVLEKAGFHSEGLARKNVKINGQWEDHRVLANINPDDI